MQARTTAPAHKCRWNREAYLRFDLSSVSSIGSAKLRLFGKLDNTSAASVGFTIYNASNTTWSESGLTWNNKPAAGTTVRGSGTVTGTTGKWYEVDLTSFLKAEKAAGRNLVTLVIRAGAASPSNIVFDSDEAANRPALVVA
jgi:endoglucanase